MSARRGGGTGSVLDRDTTTASPLVDPRLRARRIHIRRSEGRRRLRRLLAAVAVTVVCLMAWGITQSPLLDVDHIDVTGATETAVADVRLASGIELGDPLIELELDSAADSVARLPWVETAVVERTWGGTVRIAVVERRPVAVVLIRSDDPSGWLVDESGWVLEETDPDRHPSLVRVEGLPVAPRPGAQLDEGSLPLVGLVSTLTTGVTVELDAVELDDTGEYWLRLLPSAGGVDPTRVTDGPGRVRLGDARDLTDQVVATETMLTRVDLECVAVIDVRVAAAPVLTRHAGCADQ